MSGGLAEGSPDLGRALGAASGRVAASRSTRDLFPAPLLDVPPPLVAASAGAARARRREQLAIGVANEAITALNWLAGYHAGERPRPVDDAQLLLHERVRGLASGRRPGSAPTATAALKRMLRGHSPYEAGVTTTRVASFKLDRISLPKSVRSCPFADEVAPQEVAKYLLDYQERMLRQGDFLPTIEPYLDPKLKYHQKEYQRLARKLFDIGMVDWTVAPRCRIGLFCVLKSDGKSLRLIVDARRTNEVFDDPSGVDLLTAEGFSRGEVVLPAGMAPRSQEAVEYLSRLRLVVGTSDVANCFHCLKLRPEMSAYFGLPAVPAHVFGLEGSIVGGRRLDRTSPVYPVWCVLPMGFTWSAVDCTAHK